jgi:glycosyltransferase involved in cell wall biosynthesis
MSHKDIFVIGTRGIPNIQGGVEKHCEQLYPLVSKYGFTFTVFNRLPYFSKLNKPSNWNGVKLIYLWSPKKRNIETFVHTLLSSLFCIIKRPKIVHLHNIGPALFIPIIKLFKIRTILTYHSINYEHQKWGNFAKTILKIGEKIGLKYADRIIVVSKTTKKMLEKKYGRMEMTYIPNGVNIQDPLPMGKYLNIYNLEPKKYIFTACRFVPEKGLHDLILAYNNIENKNFKLLIAGDGEYETEYVKEIKKSTINSTDIVLTGYISGKPLRELFSNALLFILPSYSEGTPIALLEAMSYGLPVLVSDIPQNRDLNLPKYRYYKVGDILELSTKILKLSKIGISDEERRIQFSILQKKYDWNIVAKETYKVYQNLIKSYQ